MGTILHFCPATGEETAFSCWECGDVAKKPNQELVEAARLISKAYLLPEVEQVLKIVLPFLKDTQKRSGSFSNQRIRADAEDSLKAVQSLLAKLKGE